MKYEAGWLTSFGQSCKKPAGKSKPLLPAIIIAIMKGPA
jgi:hypothetical protein